MPRPLRFFPPGSVVHAVNRGNEKRTLFEHHFDFEHFLDLVSATKAKRPIRIICYCLMRNHWHIVVWAKEEGDVSTFFHALTTTHALRRRKVTRSVGLGHVYQDRFRARLLLNESYYFNTLRYVEQNPLRAGLVSRASQWRWSSLHERLGTERGILEDGPLALPADWPQLVDEHLPSDELEQIRKDLQKR